MFFWQQVFNTGAKKRATPKIAVKTLNFSLLQKTFFLIES